MKLNCPSKTLGQFQNFQKPQRSFIPKIARLVTGYPHQTDKHFKLKLIFFNSYKSVSGQSQNNSVKGAIMITLKHVIIYIARLFQGEDWFQDD